MRIRRKHLIALTVVGVVAAASTFAGVGGDVPGLPSGNGPQVRADSCTAAGPDYPRGPKSPTALGTAAPQLSSTVNSPATLQDLTQSADLVVEGQVSAVAAGPALTIGGGSLPTQRITVSVCRVLAGSATDDTVTLYKTGDSTSSAEHDPFYATGERYLLFLRERLDQNGTWDGTYIPEGPAGRYFEQSDGMLLPALQASATTVQPVAEPTFTTPDAATGTEIVTGPDTANAPALAPNPPSTAQTSPAETAITGQSVAALTSTIQADWHPVSGTRPQIVTKASADVTAQSASSKNAAAKRVLQSALGNSTSAAASAASSGTPSVTKASYPANAASYWGTIGSADGRTWTGGALWLHIHPSVIRTWFEGSPQEVADARAAAADWDRGTPYSFVGASSPQAADLIVQVADFGVQDWCGLASPDYHSTGNAPHVAWARINSNRSDCNWTGNFDYDIRAIACQEIGHDLGLTHRVGDCMAFTYWMGPGQYSDTPASWSTGTLTNLRAAHGAGWGAGLDRPAAIWSNVHPYSFAPGHYSLYANGSALTWQPDGNLVLYTPNGVAWSSGTSGKGATSLNFQSDGNVVIRRGATALWASNTVAPGKGSFSWTLSGGHMVFAAAYPSNPIIHWSSATPVTYAPGQFRLTQGNSELVWQTDGNLVIYSPSGPVWQSHTYGKHATSLNFQTDGNVVIRSGATALWASSTVSPGRVAFAWTLAGDHMVFASALPDDPRIGWNRKHGAVFQPGAFQLSEGSTKLVFQTDGNLVMYAGSTPVWQSHTYGKGATSLDFQTDGNIVIHRGTAALWASGTRQVHPGSYSWTISGNTMAYAARHKP